MKKIEVGNYIHLRSSTKYNLINQARDMLCIVSVIRETHISLQSIENNKRFIRDNNSSASEMLAVYTPKEFREKYPELMI
jgi:hypothetical protein